MPTCFLYWLNSLLVGKHGVFLSHDGRGRFRVNSAFPQESYPTKQMVNSSPGVKESFSHVHGAQLAEQSDHQGGG